jgi:hypothetical protein
MRSDRVTWTASGRAIGLPGIGTVAAAVTLDVPLAAPVVTV